MELTIQIIQTLWAAAGFGLGVVVGVWIYQSEKEKNVEHRDWSGVVSIIFAVVFCSVLIGLPFFVWFLITDWDRSKI